MGGRGSGRRQKPAALRAIEGSRARKRHYPQPTQVAGEPPKPVARMTRAEAERWDELAALLRGQGRLFLAAGPALLMAARAYARWESFYADNDRTWTRSVAGQERAANDLLLKRLVELGLTPASVGRVQMPKKTEDTGDAFDRFLTAVK